MADTLEKLAALESDDAEPTKTPFGPYEEEAIISLVLDHPEFCTVVIDYLQPQMFKQIITQYVWGKIKQAQEKFGVVPTRKILKDMVMQELTDDEPWEKILELVDRPSNHREVPIIKDTLLRWTRDKAFGLLYGDEAQDAYARGDYTYLEKIVTEANRIADVNYTGFWFFDNYPLLFEPDIIDHRTTGFPKLDLVLNNGGPSPKEVVCYMASTGVGKSIVLCNSAITSLKGMGPSGQPGQDVLLITFELDQIKTAMRCLGVLARDVPLDKFGERKDYISRVVAQTQETYGKRFLIVEWPPEECSVTNIYALLDSLKRLESWHPDVIIIDYLDLMISRQASYNEKDYDRQKHVANEVRGLARNENVLVFTATQTNRSGVSTGDEPVRGESRGRNDRVAAVADLNKVAESFGKQFSLDYVISINQTPSERQAEPARMRLYVAKNRNGPKNETIDCTIEYNTMVVREEP